MPIHYEFRQLIYLMNIQTHRNTIPKCLIVCANFNSQLLCDNLQKFVFCPVCCRKVNVHVFCEIPYAVILPKKCGCQLKVKRLCRLHPFIHMWAMPW